MTKVRLIQGEHYIDINTSDIAHFTMMALQNPNITIILNCPDDVKARRVESNNSSGLTKLEYVGRENKEHLDRIAGIKLIRNATNMGLAESKDFLDAEPCQGQTITITQPGVDVRELVWNLQVAGYFFQKTA